MTQSNESYDPIKKSWREAGGFNVRWLKHGETLNWTQRIGFPVISFLFLSGLLCHKMSIHNLLGHDLLISIISLIPALIFGMPGILGLLNVLRFRDR